MCRSVWTRSRPAIFAPQLKSNKHDMLACSRLRNTGEKSFGKKEKSKKRAGAGERQGGPFPKSCASYFRFARFNTFPLYYLRAWHRLMTCMSHCNLINYKILACLICGHDVCPSCCRPSPGDQELTETGLKPGFRQVHNTYISCNWSHASPSLNFRAWSSPHNTKIPSVIHAFVVSEKEIRRANKRQENWSNACQLGFEFATEK